ncbi:hypothetical protein [Limosilactobacillus mucosae]|jgi:arabinogalactan endo-1,4-beta-galactosidase|uniref:hypothetical protein n=1 Tax=Limosilactobacillus mucosae TaxID=97478 RepID=UPI0015B8AAE3|nr:hypothetical protein [Limosilactobacillus mucosae]
MVKDDVTSDASKGSNTEAMSMTSLAATTTKDGLVSENGNTYYYEKGKQLKNTFKTKPLMEKCVTSKPMG